MENWRVGVRPVLAGAFRFGLVSVLVFGTVAFWEVRLVRGLGLAGAYLLWTVLFVGGGALSLNPLARGVSRGPFTQWFVLAFLAYALCWCGAWFKFPNRLGEWLGAVIGSAAMAGLLRCGKLSHGSWWELSLALVIGNAIGYFTGDYLHIAWGRPWGMVAWGVTFGVGTGGALGWVLAARYPGAAVGNSTA